MVVLNLSVAFFFMYFWLPSTKINVIEMQFAVFYAAVICRERDCLVTGILAS